MSYKIIRDANNRHQTGREIVAVLDTDEDLAALGNAYAPGSQAIVAQQGGNTYMMNASGEWVKLDDGGSTSGGSGLPAGAKPNQYIVTDGDGNAKWEDRPFYEETVTTIILDEREVTTTPNESYGGINDGTLCTLAELYDAVLNTGDASFTVYLNGEKYKDLTFDGNMLGDESFETYPFCIALVDPVLIATKTSGTHTIKIEAVTKEKTVHLGSGLVFSTDWDADRNPFLSLEQVSAIKKAYEAGVAVQLYTNYENKGVIATVHDASHGFIRAFSIETDVRGCVEMVAYTFRVSDGGIERCYRSIGGTITENGDNLPVMCIKNRYYKVSVNSDGALIATEITA